MAFLGCMIGVAITVCVYGSVRRVRNRNLAAPSSVSLEEQLTAMAVMAMFTAYRCIETKDLDGAKTSLADFVATWCGMIGRQPASGQIPARTLALVRSESREFPHLALLVESRIREWQSQSTEEMIAEMETELANQASQPIAARAAQAER